VCGKRGRKESDQSWKKTSERTKGKKARSQLEGDAQSEVRTKAGRGKKKLMGGEEGFGMGVAVLGGPEGVELGKTSTRLKSKNP